MRRLSLLVALAACSDAVPAGIDLNAMDRGADPCRDFYQYACGGFISSHPLKSDGAAYPRYVQAYFATEDAEHELVDQPGILNQFYGLCLGAANPGPVDRIFDDIDLLPSPAALAELQTVGAGALFGFGAAHDLMLPKSVIAQAAEGGIGLPDRQYYLDPLASQILPLYRQHIIALMNLLALSPEDPSLTADAVINIETALATAMLDVDQRRDPMATYHIQPLQALRDLLPHFDVDGYLKATGAPAFTELNVTVPAFFTVVDQVLATVSAADLKRYMKWRAAEALAFAMDDTVVAEEYRFHDGVFYGFTTPLPRGEYCLRQTAGMLSFTMSQAYVATLSPVLRDRAAAMVDRLRAALRSDLQTTDWLDAPTRTAALDKLDALRAEIFAPDDFSLYETTQSNLTPIFQLAVVDLRQEGRARDLARIGSDDTRDWFLAPVTVNAAYSPIHNAINLPAAILQAPFFDGSYAEAVNYGALGSVVGHELTHGFDDEGRKFDQSGALVNWWSDAVQASFQARAQCVIDGYSAVQVAPGAFVDGQLTLGENIADLGGVKLAYAALAPSRDKHGTFSDEQAYFIAYAQSRCDSIRPEAVLTDLRSDPHSPDSVRVNQVLAYTPELAAAFSCPSGAPLAPANRCAVW